MPQSGVRQRLVRIARGVGPYAAAALFVAITVAVVEALAPVAWVPHISVLFLGCVLAAAVPWGVGPSLLAVALAVAASAYFFLPPIYSFWVDRTQDIVDLTAFALLAVVLSQQTARIRRNAAQARAKERLVSDLYAFSRRISGIVDRDELLRTMLDGLRPIFGGHLAFVLPAIDAAEEIVRDPDATLDQPALAAARRTMRTGLADASAEGTWRLFPLKAGGRVVAVLIASGRGMPDTAAEAGVDPIAMLDQAAIAIERADLARAVENAKVKARTDDLREALVDSVSHDLKTPLTSIIGSATALKDFWRKYDEGARIELVATIQEEAVRLGRVVGNALDLARFRSGEMKPRRETTEAADIVNTAVADAQRMAPGRSFDVNLPEDLPMLDLDPFLAERALVQVLENAAKYSPPETSISVVARASSNEVAIEVSDRGIGFAPEEAPYIFDHFYRGVGDDKRIAGTGLGLAIARTFVEADGGSIVAISRGRGSGATFRVAYPVQPGRHEPEADR